MAKNKNHHLVKRGDTWYFRKRIKGKWIKKRLSTSVTEARRLRDEWLKEIMLFGEIQKPQLDDGGPLFGEVAGKWAKIKSTETKASTMRDYRSAMNLYVLPRFGNYPIKEISYLDVEEFKADLTCSAKRINNILVPMRSVFAMAFKEGIIKDNVMSKVDNLRTDDPSINPLSLDEALKVIESAHPHYRNSLTTLLFTGLRFGDMAGLKWHNVDLMRKTARICETLVYGTEGRPKTKKSNRDIDLLPPVIEALENQKKATFGKSKYVFLDVSGKPLNPDHVRKVIWKPALKKAGIKYRPLMQTRHSFATIMLSEGENIGWIQNMLGHSSLQMIFTKYYAWIPRKTRNDGSAFMKAFDSANMESSGKEASLQKVTQMCPIPRKRALVAGAGFEPATFGL